jgi:hypothetical protein
MSRLRHALWDCFVLQDDEIERDQRHAILHEAIDELPRHAKRVMRGHLAGDSLGMMARKMGRSQTWVRTVLAEARDAVRQHVVGA